MSDYVINTQQIVCVAQFVAKAGKRDEFSGGIGKLDP